MTASRQALLFLTSDEAQLRVAEEASERVHWRVVPVASRTELVRARVPGMVLIDHAFAPDKTFALVAESRTRWPTVPILFLAQSASPQLAVEAVRAGATDYLVAPLDVHHLAARIRKSIDTPGEADLHPLRELVSVPVEFDAMVGTAQAFRTALAKAATAARSHTHVLVEGERGTGKTMVLRAVHASSPRAKAPLHHVRVAGLRGNEAMSVLFGHERGAFPGAFEARTGLIQQCDGGSLLIDGVGQLPKDVQQMLATTMAEGIVRPAGALHGYRVDVRYLFALDVTPSGSSPSSLEPNLAAFLPGAICIPPLRERAGDIPALTRHFLARIGEQPGVSHHSIADSGLNLLETYDWPGNVRQLQSVLFRAAIASEEEALTAASFPQLSALLGEMADRAESRQRGLGIMLYTDDGNLRALEEIEADVIRLAIGHYRGKMTEVARRLGIGRSTLYRKLAELGIDNAA